MKFILLALIRFYRLVVSPFYQPCCRFTPNCSNYARDVVQTFGAIKGSWLTLKRLCRCHPWGGYGYYPLPDKFASDKNSKDKTNETEPSTQRPLFP